MRTTFWFTSRLAATRTYLVAATIVGVSALTASAFSRTSAWIAGLNNARQFVVVALPALLAWVWGTHADARSNEVWQLGGVAPRAQRYRQAVVAGLAGVLGACIVAVGYGALAAIDAPDTPISTHGEVSRAVIYAITTYIGVMALTTALVLGRSRAQAAAAAIAVPLIHLLLVYGEMPGRLFWLALWPTSAGGFIARGDNADPDFLRVVASCSLALVLLAMLLTLDRTGPGRATAWLHRTRLSRPAAARMSSRSLALGCAALVLMLGAVLPLATQALPWRSRPSLLLQRADNRAPDDVAGDFFQYLRQGDRDKARELVAGGAAASPDRRTDVAALGGQRASPSSVHGTSHTARCAARSGGPRSASRWSTARSAVRMAGSSTGSSSVSAIRASAARMSAAEAWFLAARPTVRAYAVTTTLVGALGAVVPVALVGVPGALGAGALPLGAFAGSVLACVAGPLSVAELTGYDFDHRTREVRYLAGTSPARLSGAQLATACLFTIATIVLALVACAVASLGDLAARAVVGGRRGGRFADVARMVAGRGLGPWTDDGDLAADARRAIRPHRHRRAGGNRRLVVRAPPDRAIRARSLLLGRSPTRRPLGVVRPVGQRAAQLRRTVARACPVIRVLARRDPHARSAQSAERELKRTPAEALSDGSDGARTRDLRRDRPAL
jgi:hypothetical protein